jgi:superfamily II DNA/RNA helicase
MDALTSFDTLELPDPITQALAQLNISIPTPIQAEAIPHAMNGKDIVGLAQTGTGKTLAFCLPLVTALAKEENKDACALVLAPTREIAIQVTEVLKQLTAKMAGRWHPVLVIGGVGMQPQIDGLGKQPRFIVATPGRLVDHMREGHAKLTDVRYLVLDEADRMLDMGFAPQLNEVLRGLPATRQTMLFSATFPGEIADIARKYLKDPVRVEVGPGHSKPVDSVTQVVKEMEDDHKFDALIEALKERAGTIIVFVRTKHRTERLAKQLEKAGHSAGRIHGDRSQSQRQNTLRAFKEGEIRILVATDIAARGIDVPDVAHIINYDIPNVPEEYIHRIGRSGRAGATGEALTFVTPHVREEWRAILKLIDPELYAKTPKVANVPRPEKPQQPGRHGGQRQPAPSRGANSGGQQRDQNRGQQSRPNRDQYRGPGPGPRRDREPFDREGRGNRDGGPREDNYGNRAAPRPAAEVYEDDFLDDNVPQPSLEEQLHRIDRPERGARNRQRGPNNGGGGRGAGNRGGRKWEAPKKHPYARSGGGGGNDANAVAPVAAAAPREDSDDNAGNRPGAGGEDKKKGFFDWWKK